MLHSNFPVRLCFLSRQVRQLKPELVARDVRSNLRQKKRFFNTRQQWYLQLYQVETLLVQCSHFPCSNPDSDGLELQFTVNMLFAFFLLAAVFFDLVKHKITKRPKLKRNYKSTKPQARSDQTQHVARALPSGRNKTFIETLGECVHVL